MQDALEQSARAHAAHYAEHLADDNLRRLAETWLRTDTVDHWRHRRMLSAIDPLLSEFPAAEWLTVGDGRWGSDAKYILDRGGNALPTDVAETLLREAQARGFIREYRVENAERLSFADDAFDVVLCKESYHHCPRPGLALYEMLRVSRRAVVLIEPIDENPPKLLTLIKIAVKRLTGRSVDWRYNSFEPSGNYVYTVSERELEKVALGVGLPCVAFKGINTYYFKDVEFTPLAEGKAQMLKLRLAIGLQDLLVKTRLVRPGLLAAIFFRELPSDALANNLRSAGYRILSLPRNPYR
jgi:ubiquinone/menaquinone biosynthesis C-methylase UbiE